MRKHVNNCSACKYIKEKGGPLSLRAILILENHTLVDHPIPTELRIEFSVINTLHKHFLSS
jgi:hypothetical protein